MFVTQRDAPVFKKTSDWGGNVKTVTVPFKSFELIGTVAELAEKPSYIDQAFEIVFMVGECMRFANVTVTEGDGE